MEHRAISNAPNKETLRLFYRFLHFKWDCETSLIATGCGEDISRFYSAISKLRIKKDHHCKPRHSYEKFLPRGLPY